MSDATNNNDAADTPAEPQSYDQPTVDRSHGSSDATQLPITLGRYRLEKRLGQGGMGTVFLARDSVLKRHVALKIPRFDGLDGDVLLERFLREARTMARINHSNLCLVHDVDEIDGVHCLVMEYVDGETLSARLVSEPIIPQEQAASIVARLARALQLAHDAGVVHRDIKPSNVLLRKNDEPVVSDFGLARNLFSSQGSGGDPSSRTLTMTGDMIGSPMYMSPEQVEGDRNRIGPATDIFSLGVVLYRMISGHLPFDGSIARVLHSIATEEPPPPSVHNSDINPRLEAILKTALSKLPQDRYASASDFAAALEDFLEHPERRSEVEILTIAGRGRIAGLAVGVVILGIAIALYVGMTSTDSDNATSGAGNSDVAALQSSMTDEASVEEDSIAIEVSDEIDISDRFNAAGGLAVADFVMCPLMPFKNFVELIEPLRAAGYAPVEVRPFADRDMLKVSMVWQLNEDDWHLSPQLTLEEFKAEDQRQIQLGRTIKSFVCYQPELDQWSSPVDDWRFAAVWKTSDVPTQWRYHERISPPADQHDARDPIYAEGWRPVAVNGFVQRPKMAGVSQIWEQNVAGWSYVRATSTSQIEQEEQRKLGREVSTIFLGTWPPDILTFQRWRELPNVESTMIFDVSVSGHQSQCRELAESGWYPVSVSVTPLMNATEPATGSIWHRHKRSPAGSK